MEADAAAGGLSRDCFTARIPSRAPDWAYASWWSAVVKVVHSRAAIEQAPFCQADKYGADHARAPGFLRVREDPFSGSTFGHRSTNRHTTVTRLGKFLMTVRILMIATAAAAMSVMFAHPADAQVNERIKPFVADARLTWVRFKEDAGIASAIGVTPDNLPTRGLGFVLGAHWYPLRGSQVALGIGGEFLRAKDTRTLEPATEERRGRRSRPAWSHWRRRCH